MLQRSFTMVIAVLLLGGTGLGAFQDQKKANSDDPYKKYDASPEALEKAKRRKEMLEDPHFLSFKVAPKKTEPGGKDKEPNAPALSYKSGDAIDVEILVTNTLAEAFEVPVTDAYNQVRPQLLKDGKLVPYREKAARIVKDRDEILTVISSRRVRLEPDTPQPLRTVNLSEWYEPLEPGLYQLTVKHRFEWRGKWNNLPTLTFEVVQ